MKLVPPPLLSNLYEEESKVIVDTSNLIVPIPLTFAYTSLTYVDIPEAYP